MVSFVEALNDVRTRPRRGTVEHILILRREIPVGVKILQYMYQISHTQHQFLPIYSRLHVSGLTGSHHLAFYRR